jgi:uncharacterized protein (DUF1778 family)
MLDSQMAKSERLNIRLTAEDRRLIHGAADASGSSVSEFVVEHARQGAQRELADRTRFELDDEAWEKFVSWLERPPEPNEGLARLLAVKPVWEE